MSLSRLSLLPSALLLVAAACWADVTAHAPSSGAASLDEVLVTGERPGPGMWRVAKDGHELWILATLQPLPKNMTWRSQAVEQRIANSQVVI